MGLVKIEKNNDIHNVLENSIQKYDEK